MLLLNTAIHSLHRLITVGVWDQFSKCASVLFPLAWASRDAQEHSDDQFFEIARCDPHRVGKFQAIGLTASLMRVL